MAALATSDIFNKEMPSRSKELTSLKGHVDHSLQPNTSESHEGEETGTSSSPSLPTFYDKGNNCSGGRTNLERFQPMEEDPPRNGGYYITGGTFRSTEGDTTF